MNENLKETIEKNNKENKDIDKALEELDNMMNGNSDDTVMNDEKKRVFVNRWSR